MQLPARETAKVAAALQSHPEIPHNAKRTLCLLLVWSARLSHVVLAPRSQPRMRRSNARRRHSFAVDGQDRFSSSCKKHAGPALQPTTRQLVKAHNTGRHADLDPAACLERQYRLHLHLSWDREPPHLSRGLDFTQAAERRFHGSNAAQSSEARPLSVDKLAVGLAVD